MLGALRLGLYLEALIPAHTHSEEFLKGSPSLTVLSSVVDLKFRVRLRILNSQWQKAFSRANVSCNSIEKATASRRQWIGCRR